MKKIVYSIIFLCVSSFLLGYIYIYNTNTRQVLVRLDEAKIKSIKSSMWYLEGDDFCIYLDNSDNIFNVFNSTQQISTSVLLNDTSGYYVDNNYIIYHSTYIR